LRGFNSRAAKKQIRRTILKASTRQHPVSAWKLSIRVAQWESLRVAIPRQVFLITNTFKAFFIPSAVVERGISEQMGVGSIPVAPKALFSPCAAAVTERIAIRSQIKKARARPEVDVQFKLPTDLTNAGR
jgi:hypothetical protein